MVGRLNPEELLSRECVRDLVARYNFYGDTGRLDDVVQLFLPDAMFELRDGESVKRAEGHDKIADLLASVRDLFQAEAEQAGISGRIFHCVSTHVIDAVDADNMRGHAYVLLVRSGGLAEWGRYRDEYRRAHDGWRFASRVAVREGTVPVPSQQASASRE
jgi:SnoaL-like domain